MGCFSTAFKILLANKFATHCHRSFFRIDQLTGAEVPNGNAAHMILYVSHECCTEITHGMHRILFIEQRVVLFH